MGFIILSHSKNLTTVLHASAGLLHFFMYANWLSAKLRPIMDMAFFTRLWYSFNTLGSALEGRTFSDVYNVPKVHGSQNHLHFELPKAKLLSMKLIHDSSRFTLKICHLRSKNKFVYSNVSNHIFFTSRTTLDTQISQVKFNLLQRFHTLSYTSSQIFSTSKEVLRH